MWSTELSNVPENNRAGLFAAVPNLGIRTHMTKPVLRVFLNRSGSMVYGMGLFLLDPVGMGKRRELEERTRKRPRLQKSD